MTNRHTVIYKNSLDAEAVVDQTILSAFPWPEKVQLLYGTVSAKGGYQVWAIPDGMVQDCLPELRKIVTQAGWHVDSDLTAEELNNAIAKELKFKRDERNNEVKTILADAIRKIDAILG